jgi:phosphoribosylamine---glycine ligase
MKIMVVGGGGREHALVKAIRRSPLVSSREDVVCVPGNAGIARDAVCVPPGPGGMSDAVGLAGLADSQRADLTVVGPELPLHAGLADEMQRRGRPVFGSTRAAARLEWSKVFAKEFMARHGIPTAPFRVVDTLEQAQGWLGSSEVSFPIVVKADGLAAGKGVVIAPDRSAAEAAVSAMLSGRFGEAGRRVVIERCLRGIEVSFFALSDGERVIPMQTCQDYKRAGDGDTGPNTGGMGAFSPSTEMNEALERRVMEQVILPAIRGMAAEGAPYRGVLYAGLMLVADEAGDVIPMTLEFNARFGDPETQVLLPRLEEDLVALFAEAAAGRMASGRRRVAATSDWGACVVMAARGYPEPADVGQEIRGLEEAARLPRTQVLHAGTRGAGPGHDGPASRVITSGGRVLAVSALGADLREAVRRAYDGVSRITFDGMHYRCDIGQDAVARLVARGQLAAERGRA